MKEHHREGVTRSQPHGTIQFLKALIKVNWEGMLLYKGCTM